MEFSVQIESAKLLAANLFTADKDLRYYLKGVCLEIGSKGACLLATDGRKGAMIKLHCNVEDLKEPMQVIIPSDLIKRIKPKNPLVIVSIGAPINKDSLVRSVTLSVDGMAVAGNTIEGRFPELRRVFPREITSKDVAQFRPNDIALFGQAGVLLGRKKNDQQAAITHNGPDAVALVNIGHVDFIGVIMPMRDGYKSNIPPVQSPPSWVFDDLSLNDSSNDLV